MMRKWMLLILVPQLATGLYGQESVPALAVDIPETGPVRERLDEGPQDGLLQELLPFDSNVLRITGEFREQLESWRNREFGFADDADDDYLLQRLYLELDYRPTDWLKLSTEFGSSFKFASPFEPSPIDEDPAYVQQLFADVLLLDGPGGKLSMPVGRHTFSLGSGRLVATRNGPNVRRSFDAARLIYENDALTSQLIAGSDVSSGDDAFDNKPSIERLLWGVYSTLKPGDTHVLPPGCGLDLYYLGYRNRNGRFDSTSGVETRHSFGLRSFGVAGGWDYNIEPVLQFGTIEDDEILAWTMANIVGYTFSDSPFKPRLGVKVDIVSGDQSPENGRLGTFNALFPNNSYFSEAAIFAPANLYDLNFNLDAELTEGLNAVILWDFLWRFSKDDAIFVPPGIPAIAGDATEKRYIGNTISIALEWKPNPNIEATAAYVHLEPGAALSNAGTSEADFFLLWATYFF